MFIDYKFKHIREVNGTVEATLSMYEGEFRDTDSEGKTVSKYVRTRKLADTVVTSLSLNDLKRLCNEELSKRPEGTPIDAQK